MYKFRLYLFISGETTNSAAGAWSVESLLNEELRDRYSLEVINVLDNPQRAVEYNILATPTLIKVAPLPERRVVGNLSDKEKVASALGLTAERESQEVVPET